MSGVLHFDDQSVLATWVAEQLQARAPGVIEVRPLEGPRSPEVRGLSWTEGGVTSTGVEAVLRPCALTGPRGGRALSRYQSSRVWRFAYGRAYLWAEANRTSALWLAKRLWASERPTYAVSSWLFLRLLAVSFFIAFASLGVQVLGLFGRGGVAPLAETLERVHARLGTYGYFQFPSVLWLAASDAALVGLCALGAVLAVLLLVGVLQRLMLLALVLLYLSFVTIGPPFLSFQWDTLLIEVGFLAIFVAPRGLRRSWPAESPPWFPRFLLKWLLFRLMFLSGMVKVTSGDPAWRNLTALDYHLWTQPLPSVAAWWMAQWGPAVLRLETGLTLVIEVVFPFLLFGNRPLRRIGVLGFISLLAAIAVTGSYGFLGILTLALCAMAVDDHELTFLRLTRRSSAPTQRPSSRLRRTARMTLLLIVFTASIGATWGRLRRSGSMWRPLIWAQTITNRFHVANAYGMFEVMTKERTELSIEGSNDGRDWRPYRFRYKPGAAHEPPRYAAPHMPRLDWVMWFAALGECHQSPWLFNVQHRLLAGSDVVERLFEAVPFEDAPPKQMRITAAPYRFARREGPLYWDVGPSELYCPAITLEEGWLVPAGE